MWIIISKEAAVAAAVAAVPLIAAVGGRRRPLVALQLQTSFDESEASCQVGVPVE